MINGKTTDTLENTIATFCENGKEHRKDIILSIMNDTLQRYQWHYQVASKKVYRDVRDSNQRHINATIQLLKEVGQNTLAKDVEDALLNDDGTSLFTQDKVLSHAKKFMKKQFVANGMNGSTYDDDLAYTMGFIFKEWCEKHQFTEAPAHLDDAFDFSVYL